MPGRGNRTPYNGSDMSRTSSPGGIPGRGRGGAGRGGARGSRTTTFRGRGRGLLQDMTAMALDYQDEKVQVVSHSESETFRAAQQAARQFQPRTSRPNTPAPSYPVSVSANGNAAAGPGPSTSANRVGKGGLGSGFAGRRHEYYRADPNLSKPITFVKATKGGLEATLTPEAKQKQKETEQQLAQAAEEDKENAPSTPMVAPSAPASPPLQRNFASAPISPAPQPLQEVLPSTTEDEIEQMQDAEQTEEHPPLEEDPRIDDAELFMVDTVGATPVGVVSMSNTSTYTVPDREVRMKSSSYGNGLGKHDEELMSKSSGSGSGSGSEEESETEEVYPRRQTPKPSSPAPPQPVINDSKPYARSVNDSIDASFLSRAFQPFSARPVAQVSTPSKSTPVSSLQARDMQSTGSRRKDKKRAKQEKKIRKAERKRGKRAAGAAGHSQFDKEEKIPREGDSDLDWGEKGPPKIRSNGQKDDYDAMFDSNSSDLEDEGAPGSLSLASTTVSVSAPSAHKSTSNKRQRSRRDRELDELANDYLSNVRQNADSDASDVEEGLRALQSFVSGMSGREQLTLDDLDDMAAIQLEDQHDAELREEERLLIAEYETGSESESDIEDEQAEGKYPVYVPEHGGRHGKEWDTDPESEDAKAMDRSEVPSEQEDQEEKFSHAGIGSRNKASVFVDKQESSGSDSGSGSDSESDEGEDEDNVEVSGEVLIVVSDEEDDDDSDGDEDEEDAAVERMINDMIKASKPARRNREAPTFESDAFDEALQAQWRKDREKKAIKRQERALARLEGKASKANKKKAKRATAKVRGFREDKETARGDFSLFGEEMSFDSGRGSRMPEFHKINEDLKDFIDNSGYGEFTLPPMDKKFRYAIHMLAEAYNMKSKSRGSGPKRHNVLYRTQHTTVRLADHRKVHKYLTITSTWSRGSDKSFTYAYDKASSSSRPAGGKGARSGGQVSRNYEGAVVGHGADKIASDNIGHRMLARMGWTEGMQIGREGGLAEPLTAIVKTSKMGLGAGWVRYNRGTTPGPDEE